MYKYINKYFYLDIGNISKAIGNFFAHLFGNKAKTD